MTYVELRRAWAYHVRDTGHYSHTQYGEPLFVMENKDKSIKCTSPGCAWRLDDNQNTKSDRIHPKKQKKR